LLQPENAVAPIDVTEAGMVIAVKPVQLSKAFPSIDVTDAGIVNVEPDFPIG
jgi:hypothetical protein